MADKPDRDKKPSERGEHDRGRKERGYDRNPDRGRVEKKSDIEEAPKPPPINRRVPPGHKP
jgi:hypothetical protein